MAIAHAKPAEAMGSPTEAAGSIFFSYTSSCTGGVGIVFSKNFLPVSCKAEEIIKGCLLKIKVKYENVNFVFINVYGPTKGVDRMGFLNVLCHTVKDSCDDEYLFLCGDFNCTEPHRTSSCILCRLRQLTAAVDLSDVWRAFN